jgi:hypothetical protein
MWPVYLGTHAKYQIFLPDFNRIWNLSKDFHEVLHIKFHKISSVVGTLILEDARTDGRTDMTKVICEFRDHVSAVKERTRHLKTHYTHRPVLNI